MAKIKRRKKNKLFFSSRSSRPKKRKDIQGTLVNSGIVILSLLLIAFIFSFSNRQIQTGVPIKVTFPDPIDTPALAVNIYEQDPVLDIDVEVLNGCGIPGLAGKVSEFMRKQNVDVVRSENADHFNYDNTLVILRNENHNGLKLVAESFGFNLDNSSRIKHLPDEQLSVDVTVIIGSDFDSLEPLAEFIR